MTLAELQRSKCTCISRSGDDYYCPIHGGEGSWIDLKVKADMLIESLGNWIVIQNEDMKISAAKSFGKELKKLDQTLQNLSGRKDERCSTSEKDH